MKGVVYTCCGIQGDPSSLGLSIAQIIDASQTPQINLLTTPYSVQQCSVAIVRVLIHNQEYLFEFILLYIHTASYEVYFPESPATRTV